MDYQALTTPELTAIRKDPSVSVQDRRRVNDILRARRLDAQEQAGNSLEDYLTMTYARALAEADNRMGEQELSDQAARTLAGAWASPGTVGRALAAVATGAWSLPLTDAQIDAFHEDLWQTFYGCAEDSAEVLVWSMLGTWSAQGRP